jgi:uncharacterized protein YdeI (YjbR/CyaY-like superfamily)
MTDDPVLTLRGITEWEKWLEAHDESDSGVWIKIAKKGSGKSSISYAEAVEGALCFGWIDGQARGLDEHFYLQRFTQRRKKSVWSQINCEKIRVLTAAGRMRESGLRAVEAAKADGRWDAAYEPPSRAAVPPDLTAAFRKAPAARRFFDKLDAANRYAVLHRISTARTPDTRARRVAKYVSMLAEGRKIR